MYKKCISGHIISHAYTTNTIVVLATPLKINSSKSRSL